MKKIKVLILEDFPPDAKLAEREVKAVLKNYTAVVTDTEQGFINALKNFMPDLIISDYMLPAFNGMKALQITRTKKRFIPFIILTGSMNEETAVECIKAGADDYVIKEHMKRLGPAILNALDKMKNRQERRKAEQDLIESERKYRNIFENIQDIYYETDLEGTILELSPSIEFLSNGQYNRKDLIGQKMSSFYSSPQARDRLIQELMKNKRVVDYEISLKNKDGSLIECSLSSQLQFDTQGNPVKICGSMRDITERKILENEIKDSETKYRNLFENSSEFLFTLDLKGNFTDVNKTAVTLTEYTKDQLLKMNFKDYIDKREHRKLTRAFYKIFKTGKPLHNLLIEAEMKDKSKRYFQISLNLYKKNNQVIGFQGSSIDITERKKAEDNLRKAHEELKDMHKNLEKKVAAAVKEVEEKNLVIVNQTRQVAMAEMISTIAHHWRQPLNSIGVIIQNIADAFDYDELTAEDLSDKVNMTMDIVRSMSRTIDSFSYFFRIDAEKKEFYINEIIKELVNLNSGSLENDNINLIFEINDTCSITGYSNEFSQVLWSIINNAREILLEREIKNPWINISLAKENDKSVITINDNGGGIKEDIIKKIYEPYFSTKQELTGKGIGLYMAKMVIEKNMNGKLSVKNTNVGAEFKIEV